MVGCWWNGPPSRQIPCAIMTPRGGSILGGYRGKWLTVTCGALIGRRRGVG